jgi:dienelactone hydrolase
MKPQCISLGRALQLAILTAMVLLESLVAVARPLDPITVEERDRRVMELKHTPLSGKVYEQFEGMDGNCVLSTVSLTVRDAYTGASTPLSFRMYRPNVAGPVPFVLVIPTMAGVTILEPKASSQLCAAGMAAAIVDAYDTSLPSTAPSWGYEDQKMRFAVHSLRTVLDFAERDARFHPQKLGVIGLSLGGITSALLAGLEPGRLRAAVVVVGGGNLPYVMTVSTDKVVADLRDYRMNAVGMESLSVYEEALHRTLRYDPMYVASLVNKDRVMMVMAERDDKVPTSVQKDLFHTMGNPDYMTFAGTHVGTLLSLTYIYFDTVVAFMNARFQGKYGMVGGGRRITLMPRWPFADKMSTLKPAGLF